MEKTKGGGWKDRKEDRANSGIEMESEIRGEFQCASAVFVPGKPFSVKGGGGGGGSWVASTPLAVEGAGDFG
ncbi:hypothetical protein KPH14_001358 [Odynerus spinipes]|uniref:Uncharacterized protein n=1 Tax=Odynerus spinipes TaxID=1348599 RepID=A0AAD9VLK1_9HYME|nr:hypothetical protein KPH14_001358 [Odynerus spinipes]